MFPTRRAAVVDFSLSGPPGVFFYDRPTSSFARTPPPGSPPLSARQRGDSGFSGTRSFPTRTPSPNSPRQRADGLWLGGSDVSTTGSEPKLTAAGDGEHLLKLFPLKLSKLPARAQPLTWADSFLEQAGDGFAELAEIGEWLSPDSSPRVLAWSTGVGPSAVELTPHASAHGSLPSTVRPDAILPVRFPMPLACARAFDGYRQEEEEDEESVIDLDEGDQWSHTAAPYVVSEQHRRPCSDNPELQAFYSQIPLTENGELSSVGSISHATGRCFPCIFHFQLTCVKGASCRYCHLAHPSQKKKRIRPSKKTRQEMRAMQDGCFDDSQTWAGERRMLPQ